MISLTKPFVPRTDKLVAPVFDIIEVEESLIEVDYRPILVFRAVVGQEGFDENAKLLVKGQSPLNVKEGKRKADSGRT